MGTNPRRKFQKKKFPPGCLHNVLAADRQHGDGYHAKHVGVDYRGLMEEKARDRAEFFTMWPFFRKFLSNRPLAERIPEMDPWLGARVSGAELGATVTGAEVLATGKRPVRGSAPSTLAPSYLHLTPAQPSSPSVLPLLSPRVFFLATSSYLTNRHIGP